MIGYIEWVNPLQFAAHVATDPQDVQDPNAAGWFGDEETASDVPGRDLGWMLAQGWKVDGDPEDDDDNPPEKLYTLKRKPLKNETVLGELVTQYVTAYNEGRTANDERYDDIMAMYNDVILKSSQHLNRAAAANNSAEVLYLNSLDTVWSQIDFYLNTTRSDASATFDEAATALGAFADKLTELGSGYDTYVANLETILTNQQTDLATFEANTTTLLANLTNDFSTHQYAIDTLETTEDSQAATHIAAYGAKLDELEATITAVEIELLTLIDDAESAFSTYQTAGLAIITAIGGELTALDSTITGLMTTLDTAVGTHKTTHSGLVALFLSDYTTHAATSRALLVDLGSTELARINEAWDSELAAKLQSLTDRGFYSSNQITQVTTRNTRERNEAISALNDKLAREKLDHEHQLHSEKSAVRQRQVAGAEYQFQMTKLATDFRAQWGERLYGHAVEAQKTYLAIQGSLHQAESQFIAQEAAVRERIAGWRLDTKKAVADGKDRIYQIRDAINRWKTDSEFRQAEALRAIRGARLDIFLKDLTASLDVEKLAAVARESIVNHLNSYIAQHADGVAKYADSTMRNGQFLAGVRNQTTADAIATRFKFCDGVDVANRAQQKLLAYQLDARNGLAVGMFGFAERRTDSYPDINKMGDIAMGLGDAGATQWVTP